MEMVYRGSPTAVGPHVPHMTSLNHLRSLSPGFPGAKGSPSPCPAGFSGRVAIPSVKYKRIEISGAAREARSSNTIVRATATDYNYGEADLLGSVTIFTANGEPVQFKDLWDQNDGMAVVALLRHFGCPCCWELASTLKDAMPKFDAAGVKLIAIGVGTPDKARILGERMIACFSRRLTLKKLISILLLLDQLPFPLESLYADPDRKAYNTLGLHYGLSRTFFNPASAKVFTRFDSLQKALKNYTISATPEDRSSVLQQGGMYVFKGKTLLYARKDEGTGDHAPLDEVLNVCRAIPVG